MANEHKYGVIDESTMSFYSPRAIDGDECSTLAGAFRAAADLIEGGAVEVSIVRCRYSQRHESWVEVSGGEDSGPISVDARGATWAAERDDDDEDEDEAVGTT